MRIRKLERQIQQFDCSLVVFYVPRLHTLFFPVLTLNLLVKKREKLLQLANIVLLCIILASIREKCGSYFLKTSKSCWTTKKATYAHVPAHVCANFR